MKTTHGRLGIRLRRASWLLLGLVRLLGLLLGDGSGVGDDAHRNAAVEQVAIDVNVLSAVASSMSLDRDGSTVADLRNHISYRYYSKKEETTHILPDELDGALDTFDLCDLGSARRLDLERDTTFVHPLRPLKPGTLLAALGLGLVRRDVESRLSLFEVTVISFEVGVSLFPSNEVGSVLCEKSELTAAIRRQRGRRTPRSSMKF